MAQLSNDCFKHSQKRISLEKAVSILEKKIKCIKKNQKIKLDQILGRILSKDIISKLNVPSFNNSAVDGYAFKYSDLNKKKETTLKLTGRITAGQNFNKKIKKDEIARIFTGARIPEGADTVIMQEDCGVFNNQIVNRYSSTSIEKNVDSSLKVTSPIVGTAYLAPEPGAKKFIEEGQKVKKGQTIMIIEAMKTMNHVPSTQEGVVSKVLVKDGESVEFGQPLISLK